ncbi:MAG: host-nuclease inhibitor Gam family protein [Clostridium sp.]|uniref:host-nuclease inhibitor Gam family protein n=1 Tax=Clostridium sp. TaxID=1506 RepID=UPI0039E97964
MLNALLENEINEINEVMEEQITNFKVTDVDSANWCFRKITALNAQIEETKRLADKERLRIDTWEKKENEVAENSIDYFKSLLSAYFMKLREEDPKAKLSTPYGKVSSRKATKWNYQDEESLLKYLKENDSSLVRTKEEVIKTDLKKKYKDGVNKETGELLPGIEITTEESITVKAE